MGTQPAEDVLPEFPDEQGELVRFLLGDCSHQVIFQDISFCSTGIEIVRVRSSFLSKDQGHRLDGTIMMGRPLCTISLGSKENGTQGKDSIVSYGKSAVGREIGPEILQITLHDSQ